VRRAGVRERDLAVVLSELPAQPSLSGFLHKDVAVSTQTGNPRVIFEENSGIAAAYPIDFVDEAIDHAFETIPGLKEQPVVEANSAVVSEQS